MGPELFRRMVRIIGDCSYHQTHGLKFKLVVDTLHSHSFRSRSRRFHYFNKNSLLSLSPSSLLLLCGCCYSRIFDRKGVNIPHSTPSLNVYFSNKNRFAFHSSTSSSSSTVMSESAIEVREIKLPLPSTTTSVLDDENLQTAIDACSTCLLNGGVISVPTDTIYGIAGLSQKIDAVNRIYDIKQRNYQNPVAISVGNADDIFRWSKVTVPRELLTDLLPGPVTVVFERSPELNPSLNPHTSKVGIRIPGNVFMQELAKKCGGPIALTSANISGGRSCLQIEEFQHLWPQLDLVVNGGVLSDTTESRLGSTVVDLSESGTFRIIRNGSAHVQTVKVLQDKYHLRNSTSSSPQAQR